jgi:hypothetical protein
MQTLLSQSPIIFTKTKLLEGNEYSAICEAGFHVITRRTFVSPEATVICRYTAWPDYDEVYDDLVQLGAHPVETRNAHRFLADLERWVPTLEGLTPKTWNRLEDIPESEFPVVVKGHENGKKNLWNTHMFAKDRRSAANVMCNLLDDGHVGTQRIHFRKYVPLKTYMEGFQGLPIAHEFRIFIYGKTVLAHGYYWANYVDDIVDGPPAFDVPQAFLDDVLERVSQHATFWVVDVAKTQAGDWIVVELNAGQQSGLSCVDPKELYGNLREQLKSFQFQLV